MLRANLRAQSEGPARLQVLEFMEGGDLRQALSSPEAPERYHWNNLGQHVALDVVRGLHFLHRNKVPCALCH